MMRSTSSNGMSAGPKAPEPSASIASTMLPTKGEVVRAPRGEARRLVAAPHDLIGRALGW